MEKRRPTYDLDAIKQVVETIGWLPTTTSALLDAANLGFDRQAICETIMMIERSMFVKSMTTYADHRIWQDVYNVRARGFLLYVKFQADVVSEFRLISFKER